MPKIWVELGAEDYPVNCFVEHPGRVCWDYTIEVSDEELADFNRIVAEYKAMQKRLEQLVEAQGFPPAERLTEAPRA